MSRTYKLLIIDDEPILLQVVAEIFGHFGYSVTTAKSGMEGLEKYLESVPDIVLMDMDMPSMSGIECYYVLRKLSKSLPVFIYTGYGVSCIPDTVFQDPFFSYIRKPFNAAETHSTMQAFLKRKE